MLNPMTRAHLPAVRFSPRAYMGCGGWDLARAPEMVSPSLEDPSPRIPAGLSSAYSRPRRTMGCGSGGFPSQPTELVDPDEVKLSCGGGGYAPEFMKEEEEGPIVTLKPGLSGRSPRVRMGCGDEPCEECKAKQAAAQMGCPKCKRIRQRAMMNQQDELQGARMGQDASPMLPAAVTGGLVVFGLFYLATR